jgi:hypothetical protein
VEWAEDPIDCEVCEMRGRDHAPRRACFAMRLDGKHGEHEHRYVCDSCATHLAAVYTSHLTHKLRWFREYIQDFPTRVHTRAMMRWADQAIAELEARVNSS